MSSLFGIGAGSTASGFYNGIATQSLRFDSGDSPYMEFDPASATAGTWTMSFWVKRTTLGATQAIFSSGVVNARGHVLFTSDDQFQLQPFNSSGQAGFTTTDMKFRDVSAWYHIVVSANGITTSNIATNLIVYVNGVVATRSLNSGSSATGGDRIGDAQAKRIGEFRPDSGSHFDGYLCDFNFVDGIVKDQNDFGEFKNGVWIAKEPDVSDYGAGGWRLKFIGTGTSTSSGAVSNPTNIGDDSSGQNNHWSVSGLASTDANMPDSPENNIATMNPLDKVDLVLAEGNLKTTGAGNSFDTIRSTFAMPSGSWYAEFLCHAGTGNGNNNVGISTQSEALSGISGSNFLGSSATSYGYSDNDNVYNNGSIANSTGTTYVAGDIIGITFTGSEIKWYKNNSLIATVSSITGNDYCFTTTSYSTSMGMFANFGQDSSFAGLKTAQGNTDENGIGDFYYAPPTGFLALCSANLPEPTISPNSATQADDHFGTLTYSSDGNAVNIVSGGNDNNGNAIGGEIDFSPDWVWIKRRNASNNHQLFDTNRGQKVLQSNETDDESDYSAYFEFLSSSNGFRLPATSANMNASGGTFVAWNWLANGATPTKTYKVKVVADSTDYGHGSGANKYQFFKSDGTTGFGTNGVDIDLQEGGTYVFDWSDSSAQGHPIRFSLTNDGTHSSGTSAGSEYTTGVTKNDSAYTTTITVASGVANLYYYCQNHSGMGAEVRTNTTHGSTNFDGSILSVEQRNTTAGFSIVTYTGTRSSDGGETGTPTTIGHGLGTKPSMVITKARDSTTYGNWNVWHSAYQPDQTYLNYQLWLNLTSASNNAGWQRTDTGFTTTTFCPARHAWDDVSGIDYVAYVFSETESYSKFGSYIGNGATSGTAGTFVYLGFRPTWVMLKRTDSTGSWWIVDSKRDPFNEALRQLQANEPDQETGYSGNMLDFYSNGFSARTHGIQVNASGGTYIYMAFAEAPFKYALAR